MDISLRGETEEYLNSSPLPEEDVISLEDALAESEKDPELSAIAAKQAEKIAPEDEDIDLNDALAAMEDTEEDIPIAAALETIPHDNNEPTRLSKKLDKNTQDGELEWMDVASNQWDALVEWWHKDQSWLENIGYFLSIPQQIMMRNAVYAMEKVDTLSPQQAKELLSDDELLPSDLVNFYIKDPQSTSEKLGRWSLGLAADILFDPMNLIAAPLNLAGKTAKVGGQVIRNLDKLTDAERLYLRGLEKVEKILTKDGRIVSTKQMEKAATGQIGFSDLLKDTDNAAEASALMRQELDAGRVAELRKGDRDITLGIRIPFTNIGKEVAIPGAGKVVGATLGGVAQAMGLTKKMVEKVPGVKEVMSLADGFASRTGAVVFDDQILKSQAALNARKIFSNQSEVAIRKELKELGDNLGEERWAKLKDDIDYLLEKQPYKKDEAIAAGLTEDALEIATKKNPHANKALKNVSQYPVAMKLIETIRAENSIMAARMKEAGVPFDTLSIKEPGDAIRYMKHMITNDYFKYLEDLGEASDDVETALSYAEKTIGGVQRTEGGRKMRGTYRELNKKMLEATVGKSKAFPDGVKIFVDDPLELHSRRMYEMERVLQNHKILDAASLHAVKGQMPKKGEWVQFRPRDFDKLILEQQINDMQYKTLREAGLLGDHKFMHESRMSLFNKLAKGQRNLPEIAMMDAVRGIQNDPVLKKQRGNGSLMYLLEHVGDITHRMSENGGQWANDSARQKIRSTFNTLSNEVDFELLNTFKPTPEMLKYADLHEALPVYNNAQRLARDAAVSLGRGDYASARSKLGELNKMVDADTFADEALKIDDAFMQDIISKSPGAELGRLQQWKQFVPEFYKTDEKIWIPAQVHDRMLFEINGHNADSMAVKLVKALEAPVAIFRNNVLFGPAYWGTNAFGNMMHYALNTGFGFGGTKSFAKALGVMISNTGETMIRTPKGSEVLLSNEELLKWAIEDGAFNPALVGNHTFGPLVDNIASNREAFKENPYWKNAKTAADFAMGWRMGRWIAEKSDQAPKLATYIDRLQRGYSRRAAAELADRHFYTFSFGGRKQDLLARGIPFSRFPIKTLEYVGNELRNMKFASLQLPHKVQQVFKGEYVEDPETRQAVYEAMPYYAEARMPILGDIIPGLRNITYDLPWAQQTIGMLYDPDIAVNPVFALVGGAANVWSADENYRDMAKDDFKKNLMRLGKNFLPPPLTEALNVYDIKTNGLGGMFAAEFRQSFPSNAMLDTIGASEFPLDANPSAIRWNEAVKFGEHTLDGWLYKLYFGDEDQGRDKGARDQIATKGEFIRKRFRQWTLGTAQIQKLDANILANTLATNRRLKDQRDKLRQKIQRTEALMSADALSNPEYISNLAKKYPEAKEILRLESERDALANVYNFLLKAKDELPNDDIIGNIFGVDTKAMDTADAPMNYDWLTIRASEISDERADIAIRDIRSEAGVQEETVQGAVDDVLESPPQISPEDLELIAPPTEKPEEEMFDNYLLNFGDQ